MGVQGLTTIVSNYEKEIFRHKKLKSTNIVIDGKSLIFFMYETCDLQHGGDYDVFAEKVQKFFSCLLLHKIEPYIVLDGGYDCDARKREAINKKINRRLEKTVEFNSLLYTKDFAPMLCRLTFETVITEMKLKFVVCDFDGDRDIVVLANKLLCPVLSLDSDFFVYNIKKGYIPLNKLFLSYEECTCMIYNATNMKDAFRELGKEKLPLLAVTLGNDYVKRKYLYSFYSELIKVDGMYMELSNIQRKVINWVQTSGDLLALKKALPNISDVIQMSFDMYADTEHFESSFDLMTYLREPQTSETLLQMHRSAGLQAFIQNVLKSNELFFLSEVEDINKRSIHRCSCRLRAVMYGVLLRENGAKIYEYDRRRNYCKCYAVVPSRSLDGTVPVPDLETIRRCSVEEKFEFLCKAFRFARIEDLTKFDDDTKLFVLILTYWVKHAKPTVNGYFVICIIICHFVLLARQILKNRETSTNELLYVGTSAESPCKILSNWSKEDLQVFERKTRRFIIEGGKITIENIHGFTQFQSCFLFGNYLNQLLGSPIPCINPQSVFNGTFLCNLHNISEDERVRTIKTFFESDNCQKLENLLQQIVGVVQSNVPKTRWDVQTPKKHFSYPLKLMKLKPSFYIFNILGLDDVEA